MGNKIFQVYPFTSILTPSQVIEYSQSPDKACFDSKNTYIFISPWKKYVVGIH